MKNHPISSLINQAPRNQRRDKSVARKRYGLLRATSIINEFNIYMTMVQGPRIMAHGTGLTE